jgi:hypothetical protein
MQKQIKNLTTESIKKALKDNGYTTRQGLALFRLMREYIRDETGHYYLCWAADNVPSIGCGRETLREILALDDKALDGTWSGKKEDEGAQPQGKIVRLQWLDEVIALLQKKQRCTSGDYLPCVDIGTFTRYPEDFQGMRPGQWVAYPEFVPAAKGQYLGITKHGNVIVNWVSGVDMVKQFSSNRQLREYAKMHSK